MSGQTAVAVGAAASWRGWRAAAPALVVGLAILGALFSTEIVAAVQVWDSSSAYSHCFFVLPIALYLAWDRRASLPGTPIAPLPWLAVGALPLGLAWLVAERIGVMEGRQLVLLCFVQLLFLAVLGWRMWWALSAALLYLFFLVPFGAFLTPYLQHFTARFIEIGLNLLGIPNYVDDFLIDIPAGRFFVAEACAGLRFLIASIAFGVLYACLIYRSYWRRLAFIAASILIPIVANGFRALGIVLLGHILGSAEAAATDHVLYGWMFFSIVILLLILAGLPFREDTAEATPPASPAMRETAPAGPMRPLVAALLLALLAAVGPASAAWLDAAARRAALAAPPMPVAPPDCRAEPPSPAVNGRAVARFTCDGTPMTVVIQTFAPRVNPGVILAAQRAVSGEFVGGEAETSSMAVSGLGPARWRVVSTDSPTRMTVSAVWIDGRPGAGGLADRIRQGANSVLGSPYHPVLMAVSLDLPPAWNNPEIQQRARALVARVLAAQAPIAEAIARLGAAGQ